MTGRIAARTSVSPTRSALLFALLTIGEFAGLVGWLRLANSESWLWGMLLLCAGFLIERFTARTLLQVPFALLPFLGITVSEIFIWMAWLEIANRIWIVAGPILLLATMLVQHSVEMSILSKQRPLTYIRDVPTVVFTAAEAAGGVAWADLTRKGHPVAGALLLLAALTIEHLLQGARLRRDMSAATAAMW